MVLGGVRSGATGMAADRLIPSHAPPSRRRAVSVPGGCSIAAPPARPPLDPVRVTGRPGSAPAGERRRSRRAAGRWRPGRRRIAARVPGRSCRRRSRAGNPRSARRSLQRPDVLRRSGISVVARPVPGRRPARRAGGRTGAPRQRVGEGGVVAQDDPEVAAGAGRPARARPAGRISVAAPRPRPPAPGPGSPRGRARRRAALRGLVGQRDVEPLRQPRLAAPARARSASPSPQVVRRGGEGIGHRGPDVAPAVAVEIHRVGLVDRSA